MKTSRTYFFIAISSIALLVVLIIQVNWLIQTARIKEELFNEKANMVLARTADAIGADEETCRQMETNIGPAEINKTDSLFNSYMNLYNFNIDYSFEVSQPGSSSASSQKNVFSQRIDEAASKNGLELNLIVPGRRQFILAEMGPLFITSVILILVVLFLFWRTILSLMHEKKISEHTTDFLNNMTHEFKTPLTNIALAGKLMMKDAGQQEKIKHYSGIILEENEKLRLQVEQVLSMTALERGEIPIQKSIIDMHQIIEASIQNMKLQLDTVNGKISFIPEASNFKLNGDKTHLISVISNLLDNAIKYSDPEPAISVRTYNTPRDLKIVITDNGYGIDKIYHEKIFEKYFRVPTGNVHDVKGFGLGLAYTNSVVSLHGGTIEVTSEKIKGSVFTITFPYV